jgi:phosphatidylglycerol lysyltransferase
MLDRLRRWIPAALSLALFLVALEVLRVELRALTWHELSADVVQTPPARLALAALLTAVNYLVLTGYDFLAFASIQKVLSRTRIAAASLLAYAIANNVGFAMLSGASVRYRFYTRWGVTAEELSRIVVSYSVTFWLGLLALGGVSLAISPPSGHGLPARELTAAAGWLLVGVTVVYIATTAARRTPIRVGPVEIPLPPPSIAIAQLVISALDWTLAGAVLYVLLPPGSVSFFTFLGAFLAAVLLGLVSHVPGGIGVFEGLMVVLMRPYLDSAGLLPALVVFRVVYYLVPLAIALIVLVADELRQRRSQAARLTAILGRIEEQVTPRLLAAFTFLAGIVLLLSGATPAAPGRLERLERFLPLGVIEVSHFVGSVIGVVLLLVSQGLARRLDAAYYLASSGILVGIAASILKGLDYEEAILLTGVLFLLGRARPAFDRRAAFFDTRFSVGWVASLIAAVGASIWLGLFAFKHVAYSNELWWQFELRGEASRFLRASVGAALVVMLFAFARLIRPAPHEVVLPTDEDLAAADAIIRTQPATFANLVHLRDKALLFDEGRTAFLMYGVQGNTWVALGDPVGSCEGKTSLIRQFLERCDDFDGVPVFYEVRPGDLHRYADFGLTFVKLGEEARVDLKQFALEGSHGARYRKTIRRLERDGGTFRIIEPPQTTETLRQLRAVSDNWLEQRAAAEKGFSLGFFDEAYVARFPIAVIEFNGQVRAFANIWPAGGKSEVSVDLMRFHHDAPKNVMEALFAHLMVWGKGAGYEWFTLGMAPLSGFERSPVATLWNRLGSFIYQHGEFVYKFQGLRAFKEKFDPAWEPRYLAYPGGMRLPRILADLAALVAGGYRRMLLP